MLPWLASCVMIAVATTWAMYREITTFGHAEGIQTGLDFAENTWRAVRDLFSGQNIYAPTHEVVRGIGPARPVSQHVPGSLLWQAPFTALPLHAALMSFTFASILAIWAAVFLLVLPRSPWTVLVAACSGAFAICVGGGPVTLLLGQPTGFMLLGLAILMRMRSPWLAGLGLMLAATTFQTGVPLALALLVLGYWPVVWRGTVLALTCSLPVVVLAIANAGFGGFVSAFASGAFSHLGRLTNQIDLGSLLLRIGVANLGIRVGAGIAVAVLALAFLARLPPHLRRIDYPPVLTLVIAFTLLCTYHQPYDMLLIGGAVVPAILILDRSRAMLPAFGFALTGASFSTFAGGLVIGPIAVLAAGVFSAVALRRETVKADTTLNSQVWEPGPDGLLTGQEPTDPVGRL